MPNEKTLNEKKAVVDALAERIQKAEAGVFVDYRGLTVAQDTEIRRQMRANKVEYSVVKNTLTRIAVDRLGMSGLDEVLKGTTSLATSTEDPIAPFRIITDYAKKMDGKFTIKAAYMDGEILTGGQIAEMAKLPSKGALYSQVFGTLLAPITALAVVLDQIAKKLGGPAETTEEPA